MCTYYAVSCVHKLYHIFSCVAEQNVVFFILLGLCAHETRHTVDVANFLCSVGLSEAKGRIQKGGILSL
jgi:hypothetical protein